MIHHDLLRRHKSNRAAVAAAEKCSAETRPAIMAGPAAGESVEPGGYRLIVRNEVGSAVTTATVAEALGPGPYADLIEFLPTRETVVVTVTATMAVVAEAAAWREI
ncbi:hypothetical protein [Paludisphaera soli]|uniref:hypothetical protein n=1 Tax=Paludisphaera soli TaxID=2712865 RepID=UPI0013ED2298|nr:hypothetical protein [Paludisphaera soli]